jgi:hypothetical protein
MPFPTPLKSSGHVAGAAGFWRRAMAHVEVCCNPGLWNSGFSQARGSGLVNFSGLVNLVGQWIAVS